MLLRSSLAICIIGHVSWICAAGCLNAAMLTTRDALKKNGLETKTRKKNTVIEFFPVHFRFFMPKVRNKFNDLFFALS